MAWHVQMSCLYACVLGAEQTGCETRQASAGRRRRAYGKLGRETGVTEAVSIQSKPGKKRLQRWYLNCPDVVSHELSTYTVPNRHPRKTIRNRLLVLLPVCSALRSASAPNTAPLCLSLSPVLTSWFYRTWWPYARNCEASDWSVNFVNESDDE